MDPLRTAYWIDLLDRDSLSFEQVWPNSCAGPKTRTPALDGETGNGKP